MTEDYSGHYDENFAQEFLRLIFDFLKDPREARRSNPRIITPMLSIEFCECDQIQNMSISDRNFWHAIICSFVLSELDYRAQHPTITQVDVLQEIYGTQVEILLDESDLSSGKTPKRPNLSIEVAIKFQDEEDTECLNWYNVLPALTVREFANEKGGPPTRFMNFYTDSILTICLRLSSEKFLRELLSAKNSPQVWHLFRRLASK